jgi:GT2 family glycosyltransferase
MLTPNWAARCQKVGAGLVGALLLYPNGLVQHAGLYFSPIANMFEHRLRYAPGNLAETKERLVCPVTGAFQYITAETLQQVGPYDEEFRMGFEDVDYCLRVFAAGLECVYEPAVTAIHHESLFRSRPDEKVMRWQAQSINHLRQKWAGVPLAQFASAAQ